MRIDLKKTRRSNTRSLHQFLVDIPEYEWGGPLAVSAEVVIERAEEGGHTVRVTFMSMDDRTVYDKQFPMEGMVRGYEIVEDHVLFYLRDLASREKAQGS